jgi:hypothetical protein
VEVEKTKRDFELGIPPVLLLALYLFVGSYLLDAIYPYFRFFMEM